MVKTEWPSLISWQIPGRAQVSQRLLELFELGHDCVHALKDQELNDAFNLLVGVGFSLWRAVFLTDVTRDPKEILQHSLQFTRYVLRDNAINFAQDRETSDWSFGYYLNNAVFRLNVLSRMARFSKLDELRSFAASCADGITGTDVRKMWQRVYEVYQQVVNELMSQVRSAEAEHHRNKAPA